MKIVAVTACPGGIAHTYMATESIENEAKSRNISCRVESQGSMGIMNRLSKVEIAEADIVIFAKGIDIIEKDRFRGKLILEVPVSEALTAPKKVFEKAINLMEGSINEH